MNTHHTATMLAAAVLALGPALAACGGEEPSGGDSSTIPESAPYNKADFAFATEMLPHHAQALLIVDMTTGRDLDPQVATLAEEVRAAQAPEIEEMTTLLEEWDQPVPETPRDHANTENHGEMSSMDALSGTLGAEELETLESAQGAEFEQLWLESMVAHHEEAIEMAEQETEDGEDPDAVTLARSIGDTQRLEVERMEQLLAGSGAGVGPCEASASTCAG